MLLVGLTGNIASGKSVVASALRERGAYVIDADVLARQAVAPGSDGLRAIHDRWGNRVLTPDGALDRAALRQIVFANSEEREALNAIVHPEVERLRSLEIDRARDRGERIVVCDIPLLYEKHLEGLFDLVMLVDAPDALRFSRLTAVRGLTRDDAQAMMSAQHPAAEKRPRADIVIDNDGTLDQLTQRIEEAWHRLESRAL